MTYELQARSTITGATTTYKMQSILHVAQLMNNLTGQTNGFDSVHIAEVLFTEGLVSYTSYAKDYLFVITTV